MHCESRLDIILLYGSITMQTLISSLCIIFFAGLELAAAFIASPHSSSTSFFHYPRHTHDAYTHTMRRYSRGRKQQNHAASSLSFGHTIHTPATRTMKNFAFSLFAKKEQRVPMIVLGQQEAALGAALALAARDVLRDQSLSSSKLALPPSQPVALISISGGTDTSNAEGESCKSQLDNALLFDVYPSAQFPSEKECQRIFSDIQCAHTRDDGDDDDDLNADGTSNPIIHFTMGHPYAASSSAAITTILRILSNDSSTPSHSSFLGFHLDTSQEMELDNTLHECERLILPKDNAMQWGKILQNILDTASSSVGITMDLATHLSMLQANRLPRSKDLLHDAWAISSTGTTVPSFTDDLSSICSSMILEYLYDYDNPFGGLDPLLCLNKGCLIPSPIVKIQMTEYSKGRIRKANEAHASAYTAMRGSGMDNITALCVANSVKVVFLQMSDKGPSYTWDIVERVADYSRLIRQNVVQEEGTSRKKYKEFGYK
jgi:hypothetical protein